jgi:hypothetical protein
MDELKFYGIYQGICADVDDPENDSRIKLQVPQVMGQEITEWARPCLPVTSNSNHPDHKKHLASEVAALLQAHADHSVSGTTGGATVSTFGSHTHSFSFTTAHTNNHTGNSLSLDHEHETDADKDEKWNDDQETNQTPEHTPHRLVPRVGQKVWVMFTGGDPNYPVWMGVEIDG